uniref:Junctophilin n=1 Tax=Trichogramma kaykai TaxID=54128 RepID=A0ABD2X8M2_9HYME
MQPPQPQVPAPNGLAGGAQLPQSPGHQHALQYGARAQVNGGRFDFDDGGTYCGGWEDGKAHGHGVCTGPKSQGAYAGSWHYGFEVSGVYSWPSGSCYEGQWQNGKRHGIGLERRGRWIYRGEWHQGFKGRYGVRMSESSHAKYEGTWSNGLQDGYGSETYGDSGTYQGQWSRGMRHGYGVRTSAPFGIASYIKPESKGVRASLSSLRSNEAPAPSGMAPTPEPTDRRDRRVNENRGGFVLKARSDAPPSRRASLTEKGPKRGFLAGLRMRKQRSTGDLEKRGTAGSIRSNASTVSWMSTESSQSQASASMHTDSNASFVVEDELLDPAVTETYLGEWKNDKRTGYGISERSDGLRYEGEWFNNQKYGFGVTTFRDGSKEEGKYKHNILVSSQKKKNLFYMRSAKFREKIDQAVQQANRASKIALQKADIAVTRTAVARGKSETAEMAAEAAREDSEIAIATAKQFAPDFKQPDFERVKESSVPKYTPPASVAGSRSVQRRPSVDHQNSMTPMRQQTPQPQQQHQQPQQQQQQSPSGPSDNETNPTLQQQQQQMQSLMNRRASGKPLPQHTLELEMMQAEQMQAQLQAQMTSQPGTPSNPPSESAYMYGTGPRGMTDQFINNKQQPFKPLSVNDLFKVPYSQFPIHEPTQYINESQVNSFGIDLRHQYQSQGYQNHQMYMQQQSPQTSYSPMSLSQMSLYGAQPYGQQMANQYVYGPMMNQQNQYGNTMHQPNAYAQNHQMPDQQYQPNQQQAQPGGTINQRRTSRVLTPTESTDTGVKQTLSDRLDHYKKPPSRDNSVDRYRRHPLISSSRQASMDQMPSSPTPDIPDKSMRGSSVLRSPTPLNGSVVMNSSNASYPASQIGQFEDVLLRNKNLGQEILPSLGQPKRTESLYVTPGRKGSGIATGGGSGIGSGGGGGSKPKPTIGGAGRGSGSGAAGGGGGGGGGGAVRKAMPMNFGLQRKKSLPDVAQPIQLAATAPLSREEVSALSSMRREEIRRQYDEHERLRANPLLYLVSPQVKDWFSRQQMVLLIFIVNISLIVMFVRLLT